MEADDELQVLDRERMTAVWVKTEKVLQILDDCVSVTCTG